MTDIEVLSKRFAKLNKICWHEIHPDLFILYGKSRCKNCGKKLPVIYTEKDYILGNPDFTDAREVLKVMEKYPEFEVSLFSIDESKYHSYLPQRRVILFDKTLCLFKDQTGLLLCEAVEWMEGKK